MPKKSRRMSAAREARKRWLAIIGIALFLAVDILLVALALQSTAPQDNGSASADTPSPSATVDTPTPTPSVTSSPSILPMAPTRLLAALDATVVWRATTGPCTDAAAAPELSADGGDTWTSRDLTGATGITALQRIVVSDTDTAAFLGMGSECTPAAVRTFVAGADFAEYPEQLESGWYLPAMGGATVHGPDGDVAGPCATVLTVAPIDGERASVLCADGSLHVTVDTGATWTTLAALPGAVAITETDEGLLVASVGDADCVGVLLTTIGLEDDRAELGCVESSESATDLAASTALDWTADGIWMWVDDRLLISTDEGESWT